VACMKLVGRGQHWRKHRPALIIGASHPAGPGFRPTTQLAIVEVRCARGDAMLSDLALELPHKCINQSLHIRSAADCRDRRAVPITVDARIELVVTCRSVFASFWPPAPGDDAPWSNSAVPDISMGFVAELGKLISDQVGRNLAAVVRFN